jgi:hypothetical protein
MRSCIPLILVLPFALTCTAYSQEKATKVTPPPKSLKLDSFYEKYISAEGLPVVSSAKVPDEALRVATDIVEHMLREQPDIRTELIKANIRVVVMARTELTTDIPEHSDLTPKRTWDEKARGLGATLVRPASSCAEENLLGYKDDRYRGESILIHEFAHTIHEIGLDALDKDFDDRLKGLYERAMQKGLWKNTYAATNYKEYWAEGVQSWFDSNLSANPPNGIHNHVRTRAALEKYDPDLANLIAEVFHNEQWRWVKVGAHKQ